MSPPLENNAIKVSEHTLPPKYKPNYIKTYENFMTWKTGKQMETFSEKVFLEYFEELSKSFQAPTLWSVYAMLKAIVRIKHNVDIKSYTKLKSLLKRLPRTQKTQIFKVLSANQVETFLNNAPDEIYLAAKVALIFSINGACGDIELSNITVDDVTTDPHLPEIKITYQQRTFTVKGEYLNIVKKYQALRPENVATNKFFLNYHNGKCTKQAIGRNKLAALPKEIAAYLNLENPETYTGHCFGRTSTTLLADSVTNTTTINMTTNGPGTSTSKFQSHQPTNGNNMNSEPAENIPTTSSKSQNTDNNVPGKTITFNINNCSNLTINFN